MLTDCLTCQNMSCCDQQERWDSGCINYKMMPTKNPTNADKIRSMTDEELAEWIVRRTEGYGFDGYDASVKAWLKWLREEVKE